MSGVLAAALSLRGKVALALALVFLGSLGVLLLVLSPVLGEQRQRLLEQDRRLLSTLRRNYEREFVYDLLSRNRESLAVHLADLASQEGLLWARIESGDLDLGASADRGVVLRLVGPDAEPYVGRPGVVLLVDRDGEADLDRSGRPAAALRAAAPRARSRAPTGSGPAPGQDDFRETAFGDVARAVARGHAAGGRRALRAAAPAEEPAAARAQRAAHALAALRRRVALVR